MSTPEQTEHLADLDLKPNEASGLVRAHHSALLEHYGWDRAFWSVLDEVDVADCIALIGHRRGDKLHQGWGIERLKALRTGAVGEADDAEAVARQDGWIYLFGSHHGGKEGPIRRREQWIARFDEEAVLDSDEAGTPGASVAVVDTAFRLHRLVNDALHDSGVELLPMGDATRRGFINGTIAELAGTAEEGLVRADDWTINIEGAEFTHEGALLLGLRYPVAADGRPVIVELDGCATLFDQPGRWPEVRAVWAIDAVGRRDDLAGVRDLCLLDDVLHVVTGDLDSAGKGSLIRAEHDGGRDTVSTHFAVRLGRDAESTAEVVREFPDHPRIEGIAADDDGRFFYVSDEDEAVALRCTPLLTGR